MEAYDVNQSNSEEKTDNDKTDQSFDDSTNRIVDNSHHFPSQNYSGGAVEELSRYNIRAALD